MMLAISMIGTAETMNLAVRLGLDPKVFNEIINSSTGRSWASEINNPVPGLNPTAPPSHNYDGGFSTALITKDLGLASSVGECFLALVDFIDLMMPIIRPKCLFNEFTGEFCCNRGSHEAIDHLACFSFFYDFSLNRCCICF